MPREVDIGWNHGTPVDGNKQKAKCNYCGKVFKGGGVSRLKFHLAGIGGNVERCVEAPDGVRQLMVDVLRGAKQHKFDKQARDNAFRNQINPPPEQLDISDDDDDYDQCDQFERDIRRAYRESRAEQFNQEYGTANQRGSGSGASSSGGKRSRGVINGIKSYLFNKSKSTRAAERDPTLLRSKSSLQPTFQQSMNKKTIRERLYKIAGKFVHWGGLPPHGVGNNPYWQPLIDEAGRAGYGVKAPSGYELMGPILDAEEQELLEWVNKFKMKWPQYGVTVMCDGWTGPTNMSLINFLIFSDGCAVFDRSIDASMHTKDHAYILQLMKKVVDDAGKENVIQIVTDNGSAYKKAGQMLMKERGYNLFWTPCAAHCIDLMLKEIGKNDLIKETVAMGRRITNYIYNHVQVLAMMREFTGGDIVRPGPTRFATNCIALKSLMDKKETLAKMCAYEEWLAWINHTQYKEEGYVIAEYISSRRFWALTKKTVGIMEPIVRVLRLVDGDKKPTMPYIYHAMQKMMHEIERDSVNCVWVLNIIKKRWFLQMIHPLHEAAYYLNPAFQYSCDLGMQPKLLDAVRVVVERLAGENLDVVDAMGEIKKYRDALGSFSSRHAISSREKLQPAEWWFLYGTSAPSLTKYAIKILSQTTSSSGCERNWSTFQLIHAKRRSKLGHVRLQKLVRVHYNLRLMHRYIRDGIYPNDSVAPIDLSTIFAEGDDEDPLYEWIREREQTDLDTASGNASPYVRNLLGDDVGLDEYLPQIDRNDSDDTLSPSESDGGSPGGGSGGYIQRSQRSSQQISQRGSQQRSQRGSTQRGSQAGGYEGLTMGDETMHFTPVTTDSEAARFNRQMRYNEYEQRSSRSHEMGSISSLFDTMSISTGAGYSEDQPYLEAYGQHSYGAMGGYQQYDNTMSQQRMSLVGDPRFPYMELAQYLPSVDQLKYQQIVQEYLQGYYHQMSWGQFCANLANLNQFDDGYFEPARHSTWN